MTPDTDSNVAGFSEIEAAKFLAGGGFRNRLHIEDVTNPPGDAAVAQLIGRLRAAGLSRSVQAVEWIVGQRDSARRARDRLARIVKGKVNRELGEKSPA